MHPDAPSHLIASLPRKPLDRVVRTVAHGLGVHAAVIVLEENGKLVVMSAEGLPETDEVPSHGLCHHVMDTGEPLAIEDMQTHPLGETLSENGASKIPGDAVLKAYLSAPLFCPENTSIGALCALDTVPRAWSEADRLLLTDLATTITNELRLRSTVAALEQEKEAHVSTLSITAAALDALHDIFFLVDAEGQLLRWNRRAREVTGYAASEFEPLSIVDFFAPADRERVRRAVEEVFRQGAAQIEVGLLTKDGRTIPYEFTGALLRDTDGQALGVCGIGRDITEHHRMQHQLEAHVRALEHANEQFSAVVDSAPGVIYQCAHDPDGSISFPFLSENAADFCIDVKALFCAPPSSDVIHPDDAEAHRSALEAFSRHPDRWSWEGRVFGRDRTTHWVSLQARPMKREGGRRLWNGIALDVTELKEMEEALRLSEARHRSLIEATPDIFFRLSREGRYLDVQAQEVQDLLVSEAPALLGRTIDEFLPAREAERWDEVIAKALDTGRLQRYEYDLVTLDGLEHRFEARVVPVAEDEVQAIVRDITDRHRYELGLVRAIEAAEQARARAEDAQRQAEETARVKATLLANMSHEIRTPLTGILGFAEVIEDEAGDELGEYAGYIGASGRRLLDTLNSVLDLAQIEARRFPLHPVDFDPGRVACETAELLRPRAEARGVELRCPYPEAPLHISTDRAAFARVVTNLVSNAVKFTEDGSITVAVTSDGDTVELCVEDTGLGIDEEFLPLLFEEFRQESEGEGRSFEGSGLGLSITKRLIEIMGGTISVESEKGEGTRFVVRLPVEIPSSDSSSEAAPDDAA